MGLYSNLSGPIPESFSNLTNLTYLGLRDNKLLTGQFLNGSAICTNLTETRLVSRHNFTGHIPESLGNLTNLTSLSLDGNLVVGSYS